MPLLAEMSLDPPVCAASEEAENNWHSC